MSNTRVYSHYSRNAAILLGKMIRLYRKERKLTAQDLADRAGISRTTLQKIEKGDMKCEIGIVFEIAALVGIRLFDADSTFFNAEQERIDNRISLLPQSIRITKKKIDDAF